MQCSAYLCGGITVETCSFVFIIVYGIIHYPLSAGWIVDQYTYIYHASG